MERWRNFGRVTKVFPDENFLQRTFPWKSLLIWNWVVNFSKNCSILRILDKFRSFRHFMTISIRMFQWQCSSMKIFSGKFSPIWRMSVCMGKCFIFLAIVLFKIISVRNILKKGFCKRLFMNCYNQQFRMKSLFQVKLIDINARN